MSIEQKLFPFCNTLSEYYKIYITSNYNFLKKVKVDKESIYGLTNINSILLDSINNYDVNENIPSGSMFDIFIKDSIANTIGSVDEALVDYR